MALFDLLPPLVGGLVVTVSVAVPAAAIGVLLAFAAGLARATSSLMLRSLVRGYVAVFRGTSALVQLFWVYFALPLVGVELDAMTAAITVLALNTGAYGAEVVRGAVEAVPRTQGEAARALGFSPRLTLWRIVLPQALPATLPPLGNLLIELLKNTALVSLVTLSDLTFQARVLRDDTLRTGEIFSLVLVMYFAIALCITAGVRVLERRLAAARGSHGRAGF
ncbi:MAG: ectoine/hydroxyectoine ABC transporter permease subunit EhuC [Proteobacteria bacterium]|nr:ectoine/hydroxyectoine ABC transporter permease subunit EhuC [Pseudomonadota bacterium]